MAEMVTGDIVLEARTLATRLGKSRKSALCKAFPHKADLHDAQQMILRLADEAEAQRNAVDGVIRQHVLQAQTALNERERLRRMLSTVIDANYGTSYHHIGDGDGIPEAQAKEIAGWWQGELERIQREYDARKDQQP